METKSMIFIIHFSYVVGYNSYFLQHPDRVLNIPDKGIVHQVDAWFSAQFLIKHIISVLYIWFCRDLGDKNTNEQIVAA